MNFELTVCVYPSASGRLEKTTSELRSLVSTLSGKYLINATIEIHDANHVNRPLAEFLTKVLSSCAQEYGHVDPYWLVSLKRIIKSPTPESVLLEEEYFAGSSDFLRPFWNEAKERSRDLSPASSAVFVALDKELELMTPGQPLWGVCIGEYPEAVAVEMTGYPESIFHEFLHVFGVSEGYDQETKATLIGCEDCWMQYQATLGDGICSKHLHELKRFLDGQQGKARRLQPTAEKRGG